MDLRIDIANGRILDRLCANESSSGSDGNLIDWRRIVSVLRHSTGDENKHCHNQTCEAFSRHLSSKVLRDVFVSIRLAREARISGIHYSMQGVEDLAGRGIARSDARIV